MFILNILINNELSWPRLALRCSVANMPSFTGVTTVTYRNKQYLQDIQKGQHLLFDHDDRVSLEDLGGGLLPKLKGVNCVTHSEAEVRLALAKLPPTLEELSLAKLLPLDRFQQLRKLYLETKRQRLQPGSVHVDPCVASFLPETSGHRFQPRVQRCPNRNMSRLPPRLQVFRVHDGCVRVTGGLRPSACCHTVIFNGIEVCVVLSLWTSMSASEVTVSVQCTVVEGQI